MSAGPGWYVDGTGARWWWDGTSWKGAADAPGATEPVGRARGAMAPPAVPYRSTDLPPASLYRRQPYGTVPHGAPRTP